LSLNLDADLLRQDVSIPPKISISYTRTKSGRLPSPNGRIQPSSLRESRKKAWKRILPSIPLVLRRYQPSSGRIKEYPTLAVSTQLPIVREELKADLYVPAAPGIVEGVARVIMSADPVIRNQGGRNFGRSWNLCGLDGRLQHHQGSRSRWRGALSHLLIMAREYGIPCVAGASKALRRSRPAANKSGWKPRVVYILK